METFFAFVSKNSTVKTTSNAASTTAGIASSSGKHNGSSSGSTTLTTLHSTLSASVKLFKMCKNKRWNINYLLLYFIFWYKQYIYYLYKKVNLNIIYNTIIINNDFMYN